MKMNAMSFLLGKTLARDLGEERSTQLGLIAGLMPGMQGVLVTALIAQREAPAAPPLPPVDPKVVAQQLEELRQAIEAAVGTRPPASSVKGA